MRFWVGGYTADAGGAASGIGVVHAGSPDSPLAGGDLAFTGVATPAASPSWIVAHPTLDILYAAQESAGTVGAFARTGPESFAPLGSAVTAGDAPCHLAVAPDAGSLVASCYGDGRVVSFPLDAAGRVGAARIASAAQDPYADAAMQGRLAELSALQGMTGFSGLGDLPILGSEAEAEAAFAAEEEGGHIARSSRAHQARFLPGGVIATTDLGLDLVRFWTLQNGELRETQSLALPRGSGPRHTVWHPSGHLYVVTELSLELFVVAADPSAPASERWSVVGGVPLAPAARSGEDFAAEIALTRDAQHVVVGIRGSNTLASLRVRDGGRGVTPVALAESGVDWPRHHVIERDTVLVAGQLSNEIASLSLDERTGAVGRVRRRVEAPSPTRLLADHG